MARKHKFDPEWEQALSLLQESEKQTAYNLIVNYQISGIMPTGISCKFKMILLLVKPTIDRRRRANEKARARREHAKQQQSYKISPTGYEPTTNQPPVKDKKMLSKTEVPHIENKPAKIIVQPPVKTQSQKPKLFDRALKHNIRQQQYRRPRHSNPYQKFR
ncbi:MAG: DUF6291 domain-containing protein [Muribaculum sp.]|nr:DUF6291 domain-containing protein [Muribaculaceae bacterium]MCM1080588.1 DUF6291 domain-containing protein [Muribaculum sp.]